MLGADEAIRIWAERRIRQANPNIGEFEFREIEIEDGGPGCDTCGWGGGSVIEILYRVDGHFRTFEVTDEITDILRQVLEVGREVPA